MLPPLALAPRSGDAVLDMCASPGSKTGMLSSSVGLQGFVLANEPSPDRLATLRVNMRHLGCANVGTCRYIGQDIPLASGTWNSLLLDAPCSGWGTIKKNPAAAKIWAEEKTLPLEMLQRELLTTAARLLSPGGRLVYSTCTTNTRENEHQIHFAVEHLGLELLELSTFPGFHYQDSLPGCLLVNGEESDSQGFFLAGLTKPLKTSPMFPAAVTPFSLPGKILSSQNIMDSTGLDTSFLPEHHFLDIHGRVYLILKHCLPMLSSQIRWQGFCVGKCTKGKIIPDPTLRLFVPPKPSDKALVLDNIKDINALLAGQSRVCTAAEKRQPFYFRNLPLGFLTIKGNRCLWSDR